MSDSEFECAVLDSRVLKANKRKSSALNPRSDSEDESTSRKGSSKSSKKKSTPRAPSISDSEDDTSKRDKTKVSKRKPTKRAPSKAAAKRRNTKQDVDLFGLLSEDEEDAACRNASRRAPKSQLPSSISSKVADGSVFRRAQLDGRYYAEVRLYATRDAIDARPETRYTKALVTLKIQLDPDQPEWELLQRFLKKTKTTFFADSAPVFYSDK